MAHIHLIVIIVLSGLILPLYTHAQPIKVINIAAPEFWCPYACNAQAKLQGFAIDITRAAFKTVNIKVNYTNMPYDRALAEAKQGKLDGVVPTFKGEAPDFIYPQQSLSQTQYCFYTAGHPWQFNGINSLKEIEFGVTSGYSYSPEIDAFILHNKDNQVHVLHGNKIPQRMYQMIANERFHALLEDTRLIDFLISKKGIGSKLKRSGCIKTISHGFLALSPRNIKRSKFLSDQFDKGYSAITLKNIPKLILHKYGIKDRNG